MVEFRKCFSNVMISRTLNVVQLNLCKTVTLKQTKLVFKTKNCLIQVIKLPYVIKAFVLSIFEWPFYTAFNVFFFIFQAGISHSIVNSECILATPLIHLVILCSHTVVPMIIHQARIIL